MAKPVIAYPGAKFRFYRHIKPYIPTDAEIWVEPFLGGATMSLSVADDPDFYNFKRMIVGDLSNDLYAFWTTVRNHAPELVDLIKRWFTQWCPSHLALQVTDEFDPSYQKTYDDAVKEVSELWRWLKSIDHDNISAMERAARTYLVNRVSFSGLGDCGSFSKSRYFNFTFQALDRILAAQPLLQKMEIYNQSFEKTIAMIDSDPQKSFIFFDPPYYRQENSRLYGKSGNLHYGFEHEKFAQIAKETNCRWFITYDDSIKVRRMFRGSSVYSGKCYITPFKIPGGYTLSGKPSVDALNGEELFISNYPLESEDDM